MPVLCLFCFAFSALRFRATSPVSNLLGHVLPFCPVITGCLGACWAVACEVHRWLLLSAARGDLPESRTVHPPSLAPPALRGKLGTRGLLVLLIQADCLFPWFCVGFFLCFFFFDPNSFLLVAKHLKKHLCSKAGNRKCQCFHPYSPQFLFTTSCIPQALVPKLALW